MAGGETFSSATGRSPDGVPRNLWQAGPRGGDATTPFCIFSLGTCEGVNQKMQQIHLFFFLRTCVCLACSQ